MVAKAVQGTFLSKLSLSSISSHLDNHNGHYLPQMWRKSFPRRTDVQQDTGINLAPDTTASVTIIVVAKSTVQIFHIFRCTTRPASPVAIAKGPWTG